MTKKEHNDQSGSKRWKECNVRGLLASSAHSIIICVILLISLSWTWFTEIINAPGNTLQTASYSIRAEVSEVSGNGVVTSIDYSSVTDGDHIVLEVENGTVYDINLSATGNAKNGGYCVVSAGDDLHYTVPIGGEDNEDTISFRIWFAGTGSSRIELLPYWGQYPDTLPVMWKEENLLLQEDIIENMGNYVVSGGDITVSGADVKCGM